MMILFYCLLSRSLLSLTKGSNMLVVIVSRLISSSSHVFNFSLYSSRLVVKQLTRGSVNNNNHKKKTNERTHDAAPFLYEREKIIRKKKRKAERNIDGWAKKQTQAVPCSGSISFIITLPKNIFGNSYLVCDHAGWHCIGWTSAWAKKYHSMTIRIRRKQ